MKTVKKNKAVSGYHLLMLLSAVDNNFNAREDMVIKDWMEEKFPFFVDLDSELEVISTLPQEDYMNHFKKCMADFYMDSTQAERNELIQFAMNLVKADKKITHNENVYLDELFNEWTDVQSDN
ncbi:MAG: hypothetical protein SH857_14335 [Chitinophagales bacterium]|nr:hypothetical protein [Chitinophagales bacterium]